MSIHIRNWRSADASVSAILSRYGLSDAELHTAWVLRRYVEQERIANFPQLGWDARRAGVGRERAAYLLRLQREGRRDKLRRTKKNIEHTQPYIHLTLEERRQLVESVADCVGGWTYARLFAECINKIYFDPGKTLCSVDEQAFEQVVSRFEQYLGNSEDATEARNFGILIHDMNQTIARKHTLLMRRFHEKGTLWTSVSRIVETPFFVDSSLTRLVQIADLCGYALRRYVENGEVNLFSRIFPRADRVHDTAVGVRHFTDLACTCEICQAHRLRGRQHPSP